MSRLPTRDRTDQTRPRTRLLCAAVTAALLGLAALPCVAQAQSGPQLPAPGPGPEDTNEHAWNKFMRTLGVSSSPDAASDINYTERAPLVIPPSRDLPQPAVDPARPTTDWPNDTRKQGKRQKPKDAVVPDTAVATPNPPVQKKPWYDPAGWFDKEEYANFKGEPIREDLTDPPSGYRVPSPEQPYGVNPNKKPHPVASQTNPAPGATPASQPAGAQPPAAAQPAAAPQASDQPAAAPQAPGAQSASTQPANAQSPR
jgi:hypothetical protein